MAGDQHLAAACERRDACRDIDRRPEVVTAAFDSGPVVAADSYRWRLVAAHRVPGDPQGQTDCIAGIGNSEHERVADRLDVLAVEARKLHPNRIGELVHELYGVLVSMRLRQRGKARDVGKEEGCFDIAWHGHNVVVYGSAETRK